MLLRTRTSTAGQVAPAVETGGKWEGHCDLWWTLAPVLTKPKALVPLLLFSHSSSVPFHLAWNLASFHSPAAPACWENVVRINKHGAAMTFGKKQSPSVCYKPHQDVLHHEWKASCLRTHYLAITKKGKYLQVVLEFLKASIFTIRFDL